MCVIAGSKGLAVLAHRVEGVTRRLAQTPDFWCLRSRRDFW